MSDEVATEVAPAVVEAPAAPPPEPSKPALPPVTSANEWKRKLTAQWLVTLPSGTVVRAHKPDFGKLVADGVLSSDAIMQPVNATNQEGYARALALAKPVAGYIVIDPIIVFGHEPQPGTISVEDVPSTDLIMLFLWASNLVQLAAIEVPEGQ